MERGTKLGFGATAVAVLLAGCTGGHELSIDGRIRPTDGLPPSAVCPIDPDAFLGDSSRPSCPDFWTCSELAGGVKRCVSPGPSYPSEGGSWECHDDAGRTICTGSAEDYPAGGGGSGWDCVAMAEAVVCTRETPAYPEGGGTWQCSYEGLARVCESSDAPPATTPPAAPPPGTSPPGGPLSPPSYTPPGDGSTVCFFPDGAPPGTPPIVRGWYTFETVDGVSAVHVNLAFAESFVDNTYGANTSDGYRGGPSGGHRFRDLVSSDHAEVGFLDAAGHELLHAKFDYFSADPTMPSSWGCLGVSGGDGAMMSGDASAVLGASSSLARNFNDLGCVLTEDSGTPATCPGWVNTVVYEMWLDRALFGASGFGRPDLTFVHASPSREADTIPVVPGPCP